MKIDITVTGVDQLALNLIALGKGGSKALDNAIKATAIEGASQAKLAETAVKTARLRSSIHFETKESKPHRYQDDNGRSFDGGFDTKAKELEAYVGTNVNYAAGIESRLNFLNHAKNYMALAYPTFCKKYTKEYFTNVKLPK